MRNVPDPWTPEQAETVHRMLIAGESFTAIGKTLRRSRSAVAGYAFRHFGTVVKPSSRAGWTTEQIARRRERYVKERERREREQAERKAAIAKAKAEATANAERLRRMAEPESRNVPLADLKHGACKWPGEYSDQIPGGYPFCGHLTADLLLPYCPYHAKVGGSGYRAELVVKL